MPRKKNDYTAAVNRLTDLFILVLASEKKLYLLAFVYAVTIGLLTLAVPFSVQMLITTLANTALVPPIIVLSCVLLVFLCFNALLAALQFQLMELFERRFFARVASDIVLRNIHAQTAYFETINRAELANRYFDIMTVQKCLPKLMIGGFALMLQTVVGVVLVSFYHPSLLILNVVFMAVVYVLWRSFGHRAMRTALELSQSKYDVARWLEELGRANSKFKSKGCIDYALGKSETLITDYVNKRRLHFKPTFKQAVGFMLLYAFASAGLLGVGGYLVVKGQLTLGQLVASELILSSIFYGMSRLGEYLIIFYDLCGAVEKISHFFEVPVEMESGHVTFPEGPKTIMFESVTHPLAKGQAHINLALPAGEKILAHASNAHLQKLMVDLLLRYRRPVAGRVLVNDVDLGDCDIHALRDQVIVIDSTMMLECSIQEYLRLHAPRATLADIHDALALVQLEDVIATLPEGLDTPLRPSGYPLSMGEVLRLKLASALLAQPAVLVLTELYDALGRQVRADILKRLCAMEGLTFLYFSNRADTPWFERYLEFDVDVQRDHATIEELSAVERIL